jgi:signal transduction histidine kinase/CheY-like chemotaxis protein
MSKISVLKENLSQRANNINLLQNNFEINTLVEDLITEIIDTEYASIWIYSFPILSRGRDGTTTNISIEDKKGLLYECFSKKEPIIYNSISSEKGYIPSVDNPDNIKIKSKIAIPLIENDNFIGIATAYSSISRVKKFTSDDLEIFDAISPFIIEAIFKMQKNNNQKPILQNTPTLQHTDENLDKLEKSLTNTKAPDEMLEYMSNIVHDIRTPANGLVGFLEILQEQIEDTRLKEYVEHARKSALLINDLTTSILDGVAQKREPSNKEPTIVNTVQFFSNIAEIFSANMSKKNINYNIFIDPLLPKEIEINSMKIKRVIMNLLSNASKFTPENGSIEFSLRYKQKEKKLHIFVRDSGIGIAKDKQEKIFEAFTQAENTTKEIYGGTGLGLSICASYVKELGGKLAIESKLNFGSTFYFDIPMDIKDYAHQFEAIKNKNTKVAIFMDKSNAVVGNNIARYLVKIGVNVDKISAISQINQIPNDITHLICFENKFSIELLIYIKKHNIKLLLVEENFLSLDINNLDGAMLISQYTYSGDTMYSFINEKNIPKILIVEDDKISIILIKSMLENEYCEIDVASDGKEGLTLLMSGLKSANPYNIFYTDHNMPLLSGGDMLKKYKKEEEKHTLKKTVTVSVSGDEKKLKEYDYDYYATKPFRKKEITSLFLKTID